MPHIASDEIGETRLVDRNFTPLQRRNLLLIIIDTDNMVSEIGKTRPRHQPDIAGAYHGNTH